MQTLLAGQLRKPKQEVKVLIVQLLEHGRVTVLINVVKSHPFALVSIKTILLTRLNNFQGL